MASSEYSPTDEDLAASWAPDDGASDDGASDDGASDDGASDDGASDDGASDDGASDDGASDDGGPTYSSAGNRDRIRAASIRRVAVFFVLGLSLLVALWALIEGGERDLWSPTAGLGLLSCLVFSAS